MHFLTLMFWSILLTLITARYYHRLKHVILENSFCTGYQELKDNKCAARLSTCSTLSPTDLTTMRQVLCGFKFDPAVQTDPSSTSAPPPPPPYPPFFHHPHDPHYDAHHDPHHPPHLLFGAHKKFVDVFEAPIHSYKFLASIYSSDRKYLCSGALITPKTVITSAQCVSQSVKRKKRQEEEGGDGGQAPEGEGSGGTGKLVVRFGEQHLNISPFFKNLHKNVYEYDVESIEVSAKYDEISHQSDIAVLRLVHPVPICHFPPIYIPRKFEYWLDFHHISGASATYLGWGLRNQKPYLRAQTGKVLPQHFCQKLFNWDHNQLHPTHLCVDSHSGVCVSDIGGPLITHAKDHWVLVGIMTFGKHCRTPGLPLVFTRITEVLDDIYKYVEQDFHSRNSSLHHEECHPHHPFDGHKHPLKPLHPSEHDHKEVIPIEHDKHDAYGHTYEGKHEDDHSYDDDHHIISKPIDAVPDKHIQFDYLK